jgi:hypothetical protein
VSIYYPPVQQHENVIKAALRVIEGTHYQRADDPHADAEQQYGQEQLALAARALVQAVDRMDPDAMPVGWMPDVAAADNPTHLRWGLNDVLWGDDDKVTVCLSGPDREPYWLELEPDRAAVLRQDLAGPVNQTAVRERRVLTLGEVVAAWHAVEGAAGEEGADPGTVLHAVLERLGIDTPGPVVAYRNPDRPSVLLCREHGRGWALTPLTSDDLPDGGLCTYGDPAVPSDVCGRDVLIDGPKVGAGGSAS